MSEEAGSGGWNRRRMRNIPSITDYDLIKYLITAINSQAEHLMSSFILLLLFFPFLRLLLRISSEKRS